MSGGMTVQRALVVGMLMAAMGLLTTFILLQIEDLTVFGVRHYYVSSAYLPVRVANSNAFF